jgi:Concanavalin A-like lectin/glucanases superfamily
MEVFMKRALLISLVLMFFPATTFAQLVCKQPPAGMISWWDAEGDASDIVGSNHGTFENGATITPSGRVGSAFSFDGVNDFVKVPNSESLNPGNQFTVEFWVKGDPTNPMNSCCQGMVITDFYGVEGFDRHRGIGALISIDGGISFPTADTVASNTGFGLVPGQWHHIVETYDGNVLTQFVDNRLRSAIGVSGVIPPMHSGSFLSMGSEDGKKI